MCRTSRPRVAHQSRAVVGCTWEICFFDGFDDGQTARTPGRPNTSARAAARVRSMFYRCLQALVGALAVPLVALYWLVVGLGSACAACFCGRRAARRVARRSLMLQEISLVGHAVDSLWLSAWMRCRPSRNSVLYISVGGDEGSGGAPGPRRLDAPPPRRGKGWLRVVFISDTHAKLEHMYVPDGDVLCHCGDALMRNGWRGCLARASLARFASVLRTLPHPHKVVIGGNHDGVLESLGPQRAAEALEGAALYLENSSVTIGGLRFHGCPFSPASGSPNSAFQGEGKRENAMPGRVPEDTDVLITHGSAKLAALVARVKPIVHAFGHIHGNHGVRVAGGTVRVNASICNGMYLPVHEPVVVDIRRPSKGDGGSSADTKATHNNQSPGSE